MRNVDAEASDEKRYVRIGEFVDRLGGRAGVESLEGGVLKSVRVRFPTEEDPSALLIVRASAEEGERIAFIGAYGCGDAILAWRAKDKAGRMKWREDVPWEDRKQ